MKLLASAIAKVIQGSPQILGSSLAQCHAHFSYVCDFMMGHILRKYKEIPSKNGITLGNPLVFRQTDLGILFTAAMFSIQYITFVELGLQTGDFYKKVLLPIFWIFFEGGG